MVKIIEFQNYWIWQQPKNNQSRIIEVDSFQDYLDKLVETSLPKPEYLELGQLFVNNEEESVTLYFEHKLGDKWIECTHFAEVIE